MDTRSDEFYVERVWSLSVVLYVKDGCMACRLVEQFLDKRGIIYDKVLTNVMSVPLLVKDNRKYYPPLSTMILKRIFNGY